MPLSWRFAARSDVGLLRDDNEDSGYAGPHVLAIADGMGGAAAGEVASSIAIAEFAQLDDSDQQGDLLAALKDAYIRAQGSLAALIAREPALEGMGTTLTVVLRSEARCGLLHVGDTRGFVLRDGTLEQITHDHTLVQTLVDSGRLSPDEARVHPQRNIITRSLEGTTLIEPDLSIRELRVGDRLLLCSDGLSAVVSFDTLADVLMAADDPQRAVDDLVALALRGGGPDNITCVVADVLEDAGTDAPSAVGAVSLSRSSRRIQLPDSPASRAAALSPEEVLEPTTSASVSRRVVWILALSMLALGIVVGGVFGWYAWAQKQYYVAATTTDSGNTVAIFRGPAQQLFGLQLSNVVQTSAIPVDTLPELERQQLLGTIPARSLSDAQAIVDRLQREAAACARPKPPAGCPGTS